MSGLKYFLLILTLTGILIFTVITVLSNNYKESYLLELENEMIKKTNENSIFIEETISNNITSIASLGKVLSETGLIDPSVLSDVLNYYTENYNIVSSVYYIDDDTGFGINSTGYLSLEDIGNDLRKRPWYISALESPEPILTDIYQDINYDEYVITIAFAVNYGSKIQGVLAADLFIDNFRSELEFITSWRNGYFYILDSNGRVVLHPFENILGLSFIDPSPGKLSELGYSQEEFESIYTRLWREDYSKKNQETVQYKNTKKINVYAFYQKIPSLNWTIVSAYEYDQIKNVIDKFNYLLYFMGISVLLIVSMVSYYYLIWVKIWHKVTRTYNSDRLKKIISERSDNRSTSILLFIHLKQMADSESEGVKNKVHLHYAKLLKNMLKSEGILTTTQNNNFLFLFNNSNWDEVEEFSTKLNELFDKLPVIIKNIPLITESFFGLTKIETSDNNTLKYSLTMVEELFIETMKTSSERLVKYSDFEKIQKEKEEKGRLLVGLRNAIDEDRIIPFFQPIYNLSSGKIDKYEVLMRIQEGDVFLSPYPYIIVAERSNLIGIVDNIVIEKALKFKKSVDKNDIIGLSINISGKVLHDYKFIDNIVKKIDELNIEHSNITFEITETFNIDDLDKLKEMIIHYQAMSFRFSIDDFGTGYSSMYYLKYLPVDSVKIDGSFIKDISSNMESYFVVESILSMARAFDVYTIAEYVENEECNEILKEMGIDFCQGYFIGKPKAQFIT